MDDQSQKETIQKIKEIHQQCKEELLKLRKEQDTVINEFITECEKNKMEELRNKLE
jgi:mRNA-degrading endonuclease RelE of RelBE toxin-antitoxin system